MSQTVTYTDKIRQRVDSSAPGSLFVYSDFVDLASNDAVRQVFARLSKEGLLKKVIKGVYEKPKYSPALKSYAKPDPNEVAKTVARKYNWYISPAGDTALNVLGLDTQVPNAFEYVSAGPYRSFDVGPYVVNFKHTTNKLISAMNPTSALVIQAIKARGQGLVSADDIKKIASKLSDDDLQNLLVDGRRSAAWIYEIIKRIVVYSKSGE